MSKRTPILSALVIVAAAYVAYPYIALYRLETALRSGDPDSLAAMVDWNQVRDGLKEEVADEVIDPAPVHGTAQLASNVLPAFGSGFMKGITSRAVDENITPETVSRMLRPATDAADGTVDRLQAIATGRTRIEWAFFEDPTTFTLWLRTPAMANADAPVKLRLQLTDGDWKITRVWLPPSVLHAAR